MTRVAQIEDVRSEKYPRSSVEVNICLPLNHRDAQEDRNIIEVVRKYRDKLTRFIYSQSYLLPSSIH